MQRVSPILRLYLYTIIHAQSADTLSLRRLKRCAGRRCLVIQCAALKVSEYRSVNHMMPAEIEQLIATAIPDAEVRVESEDNTHYSALVVSAAFEGQRALQRHQMVYRALGDRVGGAIHALSIRALTPAEQRSQTAG